ncbi:esterase/lipase family protein [Streptomyces cinerochromogenes]|uniref:esterase/lipase family protein n=1 Tax=Streptomyces cinerochromogenes TaxID=66422 RepID=UPI0036BC744A
MANTMPVLFVHGIASGAGTWDETEPSKSKDSFPRKVAALPKVTAWTFDYEPAQPEWVTDPRIGPALSDAVGCLARASGYKVVIVAHSMGGLAARYAVSLPNDRTGKRTWQDVAEVVTIGTPTRGSIAASVLQGLSVSALRYPALWQLEAVFGLCAKYGLEHDDSVCGVVDALRAPQGKALMYESPEIRKLPPWPKELPVMAIAGDVRLSFNSVFGTTSLPEASVGDIAVSLGSATAYSNQTGAPHVLTCRNNQVPLRVLASDCNHVNVKTQPTVVATVIKQINRVQREQTGLRAPELAYADGRTVKLWTDGRAKALATVPSGYRVQRIVWSASGLSIGWSVAKPDGSGFKVYLVRRGHGEPPVSPRVHSWDCEGCSAIAFRGEELVSDGASTPKQSALWSYPSSGDDRRAAPVRSLPAAEDCSDSPSCGRLDLLGPGPDGTVIAVYFDSGLGNFVGVGKPYRIDARGRAVPLGTVSGSGRLGGEQVSPALDKITIPWFGHASSCEEFSGLSVLDPRSGKVTEPGLPELPGNAWLLSSWFDSRGRVHAAFRSDQGCGEGGQVDANGRRVLRWGTAHVYRLSGSRWVETHEPPVLARETHRGGRTASLLGTPPTAPTGGYFEGRLVAQNAANKTVEVAQHVHAFAWRPRTP